MNENGELTAQGLRERFRAIPKETRDANQSFGIRIWRGLSWLERAEEAQDVDEQFIALWIAFNAIYGRVESEAGRDGDRGTWQAFIADAAKLDTNDRLGDLVQRNKTSIL